MDKSASVLKGDEMISETPQRGDFESETLYRMFVEAARYWVLESHRRTRQLPSREVKFVYADGRLGIHWGNSPGPDDPDLKPLRRKRIRITIEIEDHP